MPAAALVAEHGVGAGKMQARKKVHPTEQSLFKVRALKCYLQEYEMAKTCSDRVGSSNPETGRCRVQLEQAAEREALPGTDRRAARLPGAHREAPAIRGAARAPGALRLQEREETKQNPRAAAQHHFMGPHYNASREIPIYCAVCTCISLQAQPHHKS